MRLLVDNFFCKTRESFMMNSLVVKGFKIDTKNFAGL